jgi:hypothetical protein
MKLFFSLISALFILGGETCIKNTLPANEIIVKDGSKPYTSMMYLNKEHWTMEILIRENTLNDTALFGGNIWLLPGKTGLLYKGECFMDSMPFIYAPYKATKGRLVVQYYTTPY